MASFSSSSRHTLLCALVAVVVLSVSVAEATRCRRRMGIRERCFSPPVERTVDLRAYTGLWHQLFTSGSASIVSNNTCVTANYTLQATVPEPAIGVLNCEHIPGVNPRPQCVRAVASRQPNGTFPTQLQVSFFPGAPPGAYNIAALIGGKNYGYQAAAVYSCGRSRRSGRLVDGFYFISRTPYAPYFISKRLIKRLRCNGYKVRTRSLTLSKNGPRCKYISQSPFDVVAPIPVPGF